jgi:D-glycero-alpha-D-manno-heptose 1-phosphate guanylyltransferase
LEVIKTAVILAGGQGTRLRKVVPDVPKPMALIQGRPFLEYQMDYWILQGINKFILTIGYLGQIIVDHFGGKYKNSVIEYVREEVRLGTGGGMLLAAKNLTNDFLLLNGDTFVDINLKEFYSFHLNKKSMWTMSLHSLEESTRYANIEIDENNVVISLKTDIVQFNTLINAGAYIVNPSALDRFNSSIGKEVSIENEILPSLIFSKDGVYGMQFSGRFIDIGIPSDYYNAENILHQCP